jgi:hypothetical protein
MLSVAFLMPGIVALIHEGNAVFILFNFLSVGDLEI